MIPQVPQPKSNMKDLNLANPLSFTRKLEDLESLLQECKIQFSIQHDIYDTADKKAYYILSLFKTETAKA